VRNKNWIGAPLLHLLKRTRTPLVLVDLVYMPPPWELAERHELLAHHRSDLFGYFCLE